MLPPAQVGHRTAGRLRVRVPSMRGDAGFFRRAVETLSRLEGVRHCEARPNTGSLLLAGDLQDLERVGAYAEETHLFSLDLTQASPVPLSRRLVTPLGDLNASVSRFTGGEIDLGGMVFLGLLGAGIVQILRGNLGAPPWYTAFWYALGIFTKSLADRPRGV